MVKVVYFNQWFSSIAWVIDDLKKKNGNQIKIIASSRNKDHAYKNYVDEFIIEDWVETDSHEESMSNYVDWILDLCVKYNVDYFFVKKHATDIMKKKVDFALHGVMLISECYDTLKVLSSKAEVYGRLRHEELRTLVPYYLHTEYTGELVQTLYDNKGTNSLCLKFDSDEGGASFRAINDNPVNIDSLKSFRVNQVTTDEAINIALSTEYPEQILVMEKLDSPEISVDCYNSKQGFIAICREKEENRRERIYYNKRISDICCKIGDILELKFPYNVQFRYKATKSGKHSFKDLRLLEVNPRMSGGLYYEVLNDLNIADICLKDMMNRDKEYDISKYSNFEDKYVTHLELPIKLDM
jgi:hypothetical protein